VGEGTYRAIVDGSNLDTFQIGLVRVAPGEAPAEVAARLRAQLPPDVVPLTREELLARERFHYVRVKPTGLMFLSGVVVACLVGTVILFQVLAADVARHVREYATLQAIGYRASRVQAVVIQQGFLFGTLGFVPAALLAAVLYHALAQATNLPLYMTLSRLVVVFAASIGMCAFAGLLAVRRVTRVDPADLF
jgi:putative ABC transport system permease protein